MGELNRTTAHRKNGYSFFILFLLAAFFLQKNVTFSQKKRYENKVNTFRKFYKENKDRLFGYLLRKSGNYPLSADIMQESFTRYLERYSDRELSPSLLFTISRNLLYDHGRKNRHETLYEEDRHGVDIDQENIYHVREESKRVLAALQQLNDEEQDILALTVSSGLSYREIAEMTGNSEANIKVNIHRSRVKLKKILQQGNL